ncbi:MAG TPA: ATP synthase F1 subunit gamma [Candidatus Tumulicola sp.]|jgi:F-type H+-transporting ATPase subunit gamma|nr:ATP synthase F1 subunit gamma [Candidatus Tumulicola sp.]
MPTLRQIRDRVKSLKSTQQITRAMKMVAGARIRRAELAMRSARPYADAMGRMLGELARAGAGRDHPLLLPRDVSIRGVVLLTADKGLCGAFNSNLVRAALAEAQAAQTRLYLVGTKGEVQLRRQPQPKAAFWPLQSKPFPELARELAAKISDDFLAGEVDLVTLVSSRFVSTMVQRPTSLQLLPIAPPAADDTAAEQQGPRNAFEFEPDPKHVLAALLPKYLEFTLYQALLETQASEFAARLIAMTNATDNAGKIIDELTLVMNNTRQAAITKEILEIVGGAEALKG